MEILSRLMKRYGYDKELFDEIFDEYSKKYGKYSSKAKDIIENIL